MLSDYLSLYFSIVGTKPVPNTPKVIKVKVEGTGTPSSQTNKQSDLNDMDDDDLIASMETDM